MLCTARRALRAMSFGAIRIGWMGRRALVPESRSRPVNFDAAEGGSMANPRLEVLEAGCPSLREASPPGCPGDEEGVCTPVRGACGVSSDAFPETLGTPS